MRSYHKIKPPQARRIKIFRKRLLDWFDGHGRKFAWREPGASLYVRIVSEVLLQRTRAGTVSSFIGGFLEKYPSWESLACAEQVVLEESLRPIGLFRRRAASLQGFAREIVWRLNVFPSERAELESIPAVGQYVANAILLFAHASSAPLLDSNMARLLRRYFALSPVKVDIRYDNLLQEAAHGVVAGPAPILVNWAMLDLAALVCKPAAPACADCPLRRSCEFAKGSRRAVKPG